MGRPSMDPKEVAAYAAIGFTPEDWEPQDPIIVWPENRLAVDVFRRMQTQWHMSMAGPTGLNYASLPEMWRRLKVPPEDRDDTFHALTVLEAAWLDARYADKD